MAFACNVPKWKTDLTSNNNFAKGVSTGVVVMGGDSCSERRVFESQHHMLDGPFFTLICCKNCIAVCLKKTENK